MLSLPVDHLSAFILLKLEIPLPDIWMTYRILTITSLIAWLTVFILQNYS